MEPVRDLGRIEPWQESLERSLERRAEPRSAGVRRRPQRPQRNGTRSRMVVLGAGVVGALAVSLGLLPSALAGGPNQASPTAAQAPPGAAPARRASAGSRGAGPVSRALGGRTLADGPPGTCQPAGWPSGYVNPLAHARLNPERIDQGVDYAGSGTLTTIGAARIAYVSTTGTGWPGAFIEYRLLEGPDAGCYVYYAEGVKPARGLRVGHTVRAGRPIATIVAGWEAGIEIGWGSGLATSTYAAKLHEWGTARDRGSTATAAGKSFSALIAELGGPPGKVEG